MYISYLNDQKELGFSCIKDIHAAKLILNLKKFLKKTKRVLVAVFILLNSSCIKPNFDPPSFTSYEVYQSCVIKLDNLRF